MSAVMAHDIDQEVAELRRAVVAIREELDRRDDEQMRMEGVVEWLLDCDHTFRWMLGSIVTTLYGDHPKHGGSDMLDRLYDGKRHECGFRQGRYIIWRRPERRWGQFGSKKDLLALADRLGVKVARSDSREWIIRALWKNREARDDVPGSVGPYG